MPNGPFGPRLRKQAVAMIGESNRRRPSVRIKAEPDIVSLPSQQPDDRPQVPSFLRSHSWVTVPTKAVATERKSAGWKASDAAYFGSSVWDGVEPDRSHQKVGMTQPSGFTATVDNPQAKPLKAPVGQGTWTIIRNGKPIRRGTC